MSKVKLLTILTGAIATLAVSATPAFAEFKSTNGRANGPIKSGPVVFAGGGATVECASAEGTGTIENAGVEALRGRILLLKVERWNGCKVKTSSLKELKPTISACTLELKQAAGEAEAKGSIVSPCTIKITVLFFTCTITIVKENEVGEVNFRLEKNELINSGPNLIVKANDAGITTAVAGAGCTTAGIVGGGENKLKAEVLVEGVNWV